MSGSPLPPPLPARKSPSPSPLASNMSLPPALPRRPAPTRPLPSPILVAQVESVEPASSPRVHLTPATPPDGLSPVTPSQPSLGQTSEAIRSAPVPVTSELSMNGVHAAQSVPITSVPPPKSATVSPGETASDGEAIIPLKYTLPPIEWLLLGALVANLLFVRLPPWLAGVTVVVYALIKYPGLASQRKVQVNMQDPHRPGEGPESVTWVNHALYALFPLISTDVLTPFIDLLEDALIQQVPPIITSVRLTSPALGSQPLLLTSMRPMSDEEWFASLTPPKHKETEKSEKPSSHKRTKSTPTKPPSPGVTRAPSGSLSARPTLNRSGSAASFSSLDANEVAFEAQKRRKRDFVLQRISKRRRAASAASPRTGQHTGDNVDSVNKEAAGGGSAEDMEEEDGSIGQFVNYQVGFEYTRTESTKKKGWGLHVLAYFGWGLKGVGKSEIPVYIDILSVKGTLNLRLLLSATPPFVRTATFSFPRLPEFDISANPLKKGAFNAMELPGMKWFVQKSIAEVAQAFVRPESFTVDLDRLLMGQEASLRTNSVGILHLVIHAAEDLPKTDAMGSCDPYVAVSMTKFNKPLFSTRTIIDTRSPSWEEPAFSESRKFNIAYPSVLVGADAIESGERLRLNVCDSDRFSADDAMGTIEVEIADLVEQAQKTDPSQGLHRRWDELRADRSGMRVQGVLEWSVRFYPLWQMSEKEMHERAASEHSERKGEPTKEDMILPSWMKWMESYMDVPNWEEERKQRRQETLAWFSGEREREAMEAEVKPSEKLRSGVLQFHIHQCNDLEVESLDGTFSGALDRKLSAAAGKPALDDVVDRTPGENPDPPSAYVEVHLNDRLVYRTRTKQLTPLPYFNAVSERFLRDWRMAKITFVVRDERNREHDPILGIATIRLADVFSDRSNLTRWYPLVGGLGWGRIRLSLLFKPVDIDLPPRVSGYETATLEIKSISATDLSRHTNKSVSLMIQTESDQYILDTANEADEAGDSSIRRSIEGDLPDTPGSVRFTSSTSFDFDEMTEVEWEIEKPIKLAVQYRHSCSIIISFVTKSKVVKKKKAFGIATVRLDDCPDGTLCQRTVPVFNTSEIGDAVKASTRYYRIQRESETQAPQLGADQVFDARPSPTSRKRASSIGSSTDVRLMGFVNLSLVVHPGVSRVHKKLCKKDLRFKRVYEAWDLATEMEKGDKRALSPSALISDDDDEDEDDQDDEEGVDGSGSKDRTSRLSMGSTTSFKRKSGLAKSRDDDSDDSDDGSVKDSKAHSHALHKRNKGIFQLKIARTGKFVKDKLQAKMYNVAGDSRVRRSDVAVEHEGQSRI